MRRLLLAAHVALLVGCASTPVAPAASIGHEQLDSYWVPARSVPLEMVTWHGPVTACAVVEFTISPSGKPRDLVAAISSHPEGPFSQAALEHIRRQRFLPGPANAGRLPIRTRKSVTWVWKGFEGNDSTLAKCAL